MPAELSAIVEDLDSLLEPARFEDYCPNGLQVPGRERVATVATGVSAHVEMFEMAIAERADLLVVHHGIFWGAAPGPIDARLKRRLQILFDSDISLLAYHLPLDAHPLVGNNALLARALGAKRLEPFAHHRGEPIGFIATLPDEGDEGGDAEGDAEGNGGGSGRSTTGPDRGGLSIRELCGRVRELTSREPLVFDAGPASVRRLAIVSGAGSDHLAEAAALGADAFLTGEPAERVMAEARELSIHFIAAGHYATETFGVKRLGERLAERFALRHVFLDVPNPI